MERSNPEFSPKTQSTLDTYSPVVELRQYTLYPGQRDVLIELFDREFLESQEDTGMKIIGQFRDLEDPNRFVWLRGFPDMPTRAEALSAFYFGPVWKEHRELANSTMVDSSNALLLRPTHSNSGFSLINERPPHGTINVPKRLVVATIYYFDAPVGDDFLKFFEDSLKPELTDSGSTILAYFMNETSKNNFPQLPVREGENLFIYFSSFTDEEAYEKHVTTLAKSERWQGEIKEVLENSLKGTPEIKMLSPTSRSQLRG
ncbi:NIPSNAP family protein [Pseudalkalibacillus salsuginis]|uniref:NIPSNAP family protein n=1 Tax=Pseudalkalibacillus salsuginis TaxID=2910972 RepID=UPI001F1650F8|nr:NIPSNAP family protein [Pseudalkalibacillus salsuginis]MCF6409566.1 NIPSNAP family protein [Pseudalkalibacillus salsuginis]